MKCDIKKYLSNRFHDQNALLNILIITAYWFVMLVSLEVLLHLAVYGVFSASFLYTLGFTAVFACILALITSFVPQKFHFIVSVVLTCVIIIIYASQMVYYFAFGTLYSVAHIQQGGDAITSFWKETVLTIKNNFWWIITVFIPLIPVILLRIFRKQTFSPSNAAWRGCVLIVAVLLQIITSACLSIGGTGLFSNHYYYHNDLTTTDQATERFGLLTAFRLNLTGAGSAATQTNEDDYFISLPADENDDSVTTEYGYNVLEIDFDILNDMTEDTKIESINNYCASLTGTKQNEYTGMLSDYNLVLLCAESFATGAIHPELTPTLYKLSQEGIIFNNYYNSYPNNTTDGEYALCMGLHPDSSRYKEVASFYASRNSYLPYCLGNIFRQQKGVESYGYHNYYGKYYGRTQTHANMGYTMKYAGSGMKFTTEWPASDLEMMQQSIDDYIGQDQFHAYYMTFSGHMSYDTGANPMAAKNWKLVKGLNISYAAKCYLACNIELDRAVEYLMQRLEEEGVADKTAIVLAGDHYPYGLTDGQYDDLTGYKLDKFNKYKSSLLFWIGGMEENIVVDEYCCNVDILPTILNLWGFEYDSRMLAGTDVFSNGTHVAILNDGSFFNDKVWLDASKGEIRFQVDESTLPADYVVNMVKLVQTKFTVSKNILNTAYYNFVFSQGDVSISWGSWGSWETKKPKPTTTPTTAASTTPTGTSPVGTTPVSPNTPQPSAPAVTEPQTSVPTETGPQTSLPVESGPQTSLPTDTQPPDDPVVTEPQPDDEESPTPQPEPDENAPIEAE